MSGAQRAQMRVKRPERKAHHDFASSLGVDLREDLRRAKRRLRAGHLQPDKFRFPAAGVNEIDKRFEAALSARHRRDNGEQRHGSESSKRSAVTVKWVLGEAGSENSDLVS
jgi:hypothetical protein